MNFDAKTIITMNIIGTLLMSISLFIVSRGYLAHIKGVKKWAVATLIQSIGWIIVAVLRNVVPDVISIVAGNSMTLLSLGLYFNILVEFNNKTIRPFWIYLLVGIEMILLTYFVVADPDVSARISVISGFAALFMFASSYILLVHKSYRPVSHLLTAVMFAICGTILSIRSFYTLIVETNLNQMPFGVYPMQNISYLTFYVTSVMLTFGFVLMCNERYIFERKQVEKELIKSEKQLNDAQHVAKIGSWEFNLLTFELEWSKEHYRIFELEETPPDQLYNAYRSKIHPDDIKMLDTVVNNAIEHGKGFNYEHRVICKNGIIKYVLGIGYTLKDEQGKAISLIGTVQDITQRKKDEEALKASEEKFSLLAKNATDIVSSHDLNFNYLYVSDSVKRTLGFEPEELIGNSALDFIHPEDIEYVKQRYSDMFNRTSIEYSQFRIKKKDGTYCWVETAGNFTIDKTGKLRGITLNTRDISERKQVEEELIIAKKLAEELAGAKDRFLSNMSHEIRTPLNGIIGFTNILLQSDMPALQKKQVGIIKTSGNILMTLINEILDLAKINEGKMDLEASEFNLSDLVRDILISFELRIEKKELNMSLIFDENIPPLLIGDPIRISQVLINLINNSKKFTNKGGQINVKVSLLEQDDEKAVIEFSISDNGIGISEEKLNTIFDPFVQDNNSTTSKNEGTGLGLGIVKRLVNLMNGAIHIEGKLNQGTTVTVTIPLKKTKAVELREKKEKTLLANDLEKIGNLKILLAEDNPINQLLAQTILFQFGFEVDTAENGKIAIELLTKNKYDIILMDLKMPEMGGFEATQYIRANMQPPKSEIPIIAITADVTKADIDNYKKIGINDYVLKPFDQTDLMNKIIHQVKKTEIKQE